MKFVALLVAIGAVFALLVLWRGEVRTISAPDGVERQHHTPPPAETKPAAALVARDGTAPASAGDRRIVVPVTEPEGGGTSAIDPHLRWRELVARAPKNNRFPTLPVDDKPFLHNTLLTCPIKPEVWQIDSGWIMRGSPVNPLHKTLTRTELEALTAAVGQYTISLRDLEREYWDDLQEAYHELVERGDYIEVPYDEVNPDWDTREKALQPVRAQLNARLGKQWEDYFMTQLGLFEPSRDIILYVTRQTRPKAFVLYDEIQRVRAEGIAAARDFVAAR